MRKVMVCPPLAVNSMGSKVLSPMVSANSRSAVCPSPPAPSAASAGVVAAGPPSPPSSSSPQAKDRARRADRETRNSNSIILRNAGCSVIASPPSIWWPAGLLLFLHYPRKWPTSGLHQLHSRVVEDSARANGVGETGVGVHGVRTHGGVGVEPLGPALVALDHLAVDLHIARSVGPMAHAQ